MHRLWARGLVRRGGLRLLGAVCGIALTVALLAMLGAFVTGAARTMTQRATADVPVDWQVQVAPGADPAKVAADARNAAPVGTLATVGYAGTSGFTATTGGTVQTTGPGVLLGVPAGYAGDFPGQVRGLTGADTGVLVAQQTAANLHVGVGDTLQVVLPGQPDASLRVDGVIALPNADAMFQKVGAPSGSGPQAPPDNVVLVPLDRWRSMTAAMKPEPLGVSAAPVAPGSAPVSPGPGTRTTELHLRLDRSALPRSPWTAMTAVQNMARNLEVRSAGDALVGDNLAARLDGARADALYARVLFLFLGVPGVLLASFLTLAITAAGAERRAREQALLRVRGAGTRRVLSFAWLEAGMVGVLGGVVGVGAAIAAAPLVGAARTDLGSELPWLGAAAVVGFLLAILATLVPAWRQARAATVVASRAPSYRSRPALWQRLYLDVLAIAAGALVYWRTAAGGYQVVIAPEGVPTTSVHYVAFLAPLLVGGGCILLGIRLAQIVALRGRSTLGSALRPIAGGLSDLVAASIARDRARLGGWLGLIALAFTFAVSTAVFNTTYQGQAHVDAVLTNGADVAITGTTANPASAHQAKVLALSGVAAAEPLMHRYAYVGNDLQDLYGIDPGSIGRATSMSDAYFASHDASATLAKLAATPDGVLVSAETVRDYRLAPGDRIFLRLQRASDHRYHKVPFTFVGIAREFPTAPHDSFLVTNRAYLAQASGDPSSEVLLVRTTGSPGAVAAQARQALQGTPGVSVSDVGSAARLIGSSLTAVDLHGLTRLEPRTPCS